MKPFLRDHERSPSSHRLHHPQSMPTLRHHRHAVRPKSRGILVVLYPVENPNLRPAHPLHHLAASVRVVPPRPRRDAALTASFRPRGHPRRAGRVFRHSHERKLGADRQRLFPQFVQMCENPPGESAESQSNGGIRATGGQHGRIAAD